ncbi:MAG: hypothetical protein OXU23_03350 [Candidatus Poribacteria bacterium]|nr:hypothetical protein [Candidatus Poribacteria bacterium]
MGTSTNQSSPNIPRWQPVQTILGNLDWEAERQSMEIWQAAFTDRDGQLIEDLADPLLASACELAEERISPAQAVQSFDNTLSRQYAAGLTLDMAKRALARASADESGSVGFAEELFAEATSYYASRDLPSFVGAPGRVQTTSDSIALKENLRNIARSAARTAASIATDPEGWRSYISKVIASLCGGEDEQ